MTGIMAGGRRRPSMPKRRIGSFHVRECRANRTMTIGVPKETQKDEKRVALTPETAARIQKLGYKLKIQKGAGAEANFSDEAYEEPVSSWCRASAISGRIPTSS